MTKKKVIKKKKSKNKELEKLKFEIDSLKSHIITQNLVLKKHSDFFLNIDSLIKKQVSKQTKSKLDVFNTKIIELISKMNMLFESKIEKINDQNQLFLKSLKKQLSIPEKRNDLFDVNLFEDEIENNDLEKYKQNIKQEILYEIYRKDTKPKNDIANKLNLEFNKKLKRNKKAIIKQKMLDIIGNKKLTLPELKEEIVDFNSYCSKATFYRYYKELESKNIVSSKKQDNQNYICLPSVLEKYEKN